MLERCLQEIWFNLCQARYWKSLPESSTWKYLQVIQDKYETDGSENDVQDDSPFLLRYLNEDYSCFILNSLVVLMFNGNDGVLEQKILLPDNASFCSIIGLLIFTSQSLIYSSHKWEGISYMWPALRICKQISGAEKLLPTTILFKWHGFF